MKTPTRPRYTSSIQVWRHPNRGWPHLCDIVRYRGNLYEIVDVPQQPPKSGPMSVQALPRPDIPALGGAPEVFNHLLEPPERPRNQQWRDMWHERCRRLFGPLSDWPGRLEYESWMSNYGYSDDSVKAEIDYIGAKVRIELGQQPVEAQHNHLNAHRRSRQTTRTTT